MHQNINKINSFFSSLIKIIRVAFISCTFSNIIYASDRFEGLNFIFTEGDIIPSSSNTLVSQKENLSNPHFIEEEKLSTKQSSNNNVTQVENNNKIVQQPKNNKIENNNKIVHQIKSNASKKNVTKNDLEKIEILNTYLHQRVQVWMENNQRANQFYIDLLSVYAHLDMMLTLATGEVTNDLNNFMNKIYGNLRPVYGEILDDLLKNKNNKFPGLKEINLKLKVAAGQGFNKDLPKTHGMMYCDFDNPKQKEAIVQALNNAINGTFFEPHEDISIVKYAGGSTLNFKWSWSKYFKISKKQYKGEFYPSRFTREQYSKLSEKEFLLPKYHLKELKYNSLSHIYYLQGNYCQEQERYNDRIIALPIAQDLYYIIELHREYDSEEDPTPMAPVNLEKLFKDGVISKNFDIYLTDVTYDAKLNLREVFKDDPIVSGKKDFTPGVKLATFTQDLKEVVDKTGGTVISITKSKLRARGICMKPIRFEFNVTHAFTSTIALRTSKGYVPLVNGYQFG